MLLSDKVSSPPSSSLSEGGDDWGGGDPRTVRGCDKVAEEEEGLALLAGAPSTVSVGSSSTHHASCVAPKESSVVVISPRGWASEDVVQYGVGGPFGSRGGNNDKLPPVVDEAQL